MTAGYGQYNNGGAVNITAGSSGQGLPNYGNITLNAGSGTWTFDNTGTLTIPGNINTGTHQLVSGQGILSLWDDSAVSLTGINNTVLIQTTPDVGNISAYQSWQFQQDGNLRLPSNSSTINYANGTNILSFVKAEAPFTIEAGGFTAVAGQRYGVDTYMADGPVTAYLPTSPANGDAVFFADAGGYATYGALTIDAGTNTIMDGDTTMTVTTSNQSVGLFWNGRTWRTYNAG